MLQLLSVRAGSGFAFIWRQKMKRIKLTQGKEAMVDDWNFEKLNQYKWQAHKNSYGGFEAVRKSKGKTLRMHRSVVGLDFFDKRETDHKNHNTLDNRESNLRVCSKAENQYNQSPQKRKTTSKYKGVTWNKRLNKWISQIAVNKVKIHLGCFESELIAAAVYDYNAKKYFGEFACCNF